MVDYPTDTVIDPAGPDTGATRVLRGGSWIDRGRYARSAFRFHHVPGFRLHSIGFRLARGQATSQSAPEAQKQ